MEMGKIEGSLKETKKHEIKIAIQILLVRQFKKSQEKRNLIST